MSEHDDGCQCVSCYTPSDLDAKIEHLQAEIERLRDVLERIANFPHPIQAATGDAGKGYIEALNDVGAVAEQALRGEYPLPTKETNQMSDEYQTGLRVVFGDGHKRISAGTIEGTPALIVSSDGSGVVGGDEGARPVESGQEIAALIFESEASLDVLIKQATNAKAHFRRELEKD